MRLLWEDRAWDEYCYWQTHDKKTLKRINMLLQDIQRNGYDGLGKAEPLKNSLSGFWSKRIDEKNRIVFSIQANTVLIISCKGHYDEK